MRSPNNLSTPLSASYLPDVQMWSSHCLPSVPLGLEFETVAAIGLQSWVHCWRRAIVFCNSAAADRSGMAASRFLAAAAACVIQMSFAAESRKSYWRGCIKGAMGIVHQRLLHFGADDFLFKTPWKKTPQNRLFPLCRRDPVLDLQLLLPLHVVLLCFATQSLQSAVLLNFFDTALQNRPFFTLASRSGFGAAISAAITYLKACLCKSVLCVKASLCHSLLCVKACSV